MIAKIWADVLEIAVDQIDVHDDFFVLGGSSFLVPQVIERIEEGASIEVPVAALFEHPKLSSLSSYIEGCRQA